jgi:hypothetical protein
MAIDREIIQGGVVSKPAQKKTHTQGEGVMMMSHLLGVMMMRNLLGVAV